MIKEEKEKIINEIADNLSKATIVIATDYRGITAKDMVRLRRSLSEQGVEYKVAKNTLTKFAAEKTGKTELNTLLEGPSAIAFGYDDVVKPAKTFNDYIKTPGVAMKIKGGLLGNKFITAEDIVHLASIPSKEVLIARLLGQMSAPLYGLHSVLTGPVRGLVYGLHARMKQLENNG
jgi:large subunit ribosomal protein L10